LVGGVHPLLQIFRGDDEFLGPALAAVKSPLLLSLSVHPLFFLNTELLFEGAGVEPVPSKQFVPVPNPTKSTTEAVGQLVPETINVLLLTSATFPAVADILIVVVGATSAVGNDCVPPVPADSCIKKYPCAGIVPVRSVFCHDDPVELAYCTDHPVKETAASVGLKSSIKSFL